jgi:hypothetical protein
MVNLKSQYTMRKFMLTKIRFMQFLRFEIIIDVILLVIHVSIRINDSDALG